MSSALEVLFYVSLAYLDEGGGSLFLKTSRSKTNWPFSTKCLNVIAIWGFIVYGVPLYAETVEWYAAIWADFIARCNKK